MSEWIMDGDRCLGRQWVDMRMNIYPSRHIIVAVVAFVLALHHQRGRVRGQAKQSFKAERTSTSNSQQPVYSTITNLLHLNPAHAGCPWQVQKETEKNAEGKAPDSSVPIP